MVSQIGRFTSRLFRVGPRILRSPQKRIKRLMSTKKREHQYINFPGGVARTRDGVNYEIFHRGKGKYKPLENDSSLIREIQIDGHPVTTETAKRAEKIFMEKTANRTKA